jgi:major membrane immunogen (membrane-anchored lipoprotein)
MSNYQGMPRMIQAVLTENSILTLLAACDPLKFSNRTLKKNQYCHHVTLAFNPDPKTYTKIIQTAKDGDIVDIQCKYRFWSESFGVEAVTVEITKDGKTVFCNNEYPHITISTEGKPPVASNELLKNQFTLNDIESEPFSHVTLKAQIEMMG